MNQALTYQDFDCLRLLANSSDLFLLLLQQQQWNLDMLTEHREQALRLSGQYKELDFRMKNFENTFKSVDKTERQWIKHLHQSFHVNDVEDANSTHSFDVHFLSAFSSWGLLLVGSALLLKVAFSEYYSYLQRVKDESEYSIISLGEFLQYRHV